MHYTKLLALVAATGSCGVAGFDPYKPELGKIDLADAVLGIVDQIINIVKRSQAQKEQRAEFTKATVQKLRSEFPDKNVVVFHNVESTHNFVNEVHQYAEIDLAMSKRHYGLEIYVFDSGTFHRAGDGGWLNWAYGGNFHRDNPSDVTFFPIEPSEHDVPGPPDGQPLPPQEPIRRILIKEVPESPENPERRDVEPEDGNYYVDCKADNGTMTSGIVYYKNLIPGAMVGQKPDDYIEVSRGSHIDWEASSSAHFANRNITLSWSILGDSETAALNEACGVARGREGMWLYRSPGEYLFSQDGLDCYSMYWGF